MRNIKRIETTCKKIQKAWELLPDYRFWQFINAVFEFIPEEKENTDPFFWEENTWNEIFDKMIEKLGD